MGREVAALIAAALGDGLAVDEDGDGGIFEGGVGHRGCDMSVEWRRMAGGDPVWDLEDGLGVGGALIEVHHPGGVDRPEAREEGHGDGKIDVPAGFRGASVNGWRNGQFSGRRSRTKRRVTSVQLALGALLVITELSAIAPGRPGNTAFGMV